MSDRMIYTDDDARGLQFYYQGPVGLDLPPMRPAALGVGGLLTVLLWFLAWLLSPAPIVTVVAVFLAPVVAIVLTRKGMRHVDYYRPVRYWTTVARLELDAPRTSRAAAATTVTTPSPTIFKDGPR